MYFNTPFPLLPPYIAGACFILAEQTRRFNTPFLTLHLRGLEVNRSSNFPRISIPLSFDIDKFLVLTTSSSRGASLLALVNFPIRSLAIPVNSYATVRSFEILCKNVFEGSRIPLSNVIFFQRNPNPIPTRPLPLLSSTNRRFSLLTLASETPVREGLASAN